MQNQLNEEHLISQVKSGNAIAFNTLFELFAPKLFGFALKYLKSEEEAEELVQEVFVKVWERRKSLRSGHSFKSYLFTIALNQIRKYFRKRAASLKYLAQIEGQRLSVENKTEEAIDYHAILRRIDEIISDFPERKKTIFLKSRIDGKTSKEIAEELNISPGTVDNQISDSLKILRKVLNDEGFAGSLFLTLFF